MITGSKIVEKCREETFDRLRLAMAGGNFEITHITETSISFKHGTCLTESAPLFRTEGTIQLLNRDNRTEISYEIQAIGFQKYWMILVAVLTCWAILPPIFAYRALVYHPRQLMENLSQGI